MRLLGIKHKTNRDKINRKKRKRTVRQKKEYMSLEILPEVLLLTVQGYREMHCFTEIQRAQKVFILHLS